MTERRHWRTLDLGLLILLLTQLVAFAFGYGKLTQQVGDMQRQVDSMVQTLNHHVGVGK